MNPDSLACADGLAADLAPLSQMGWPGALVLCAVALGVAWVLATYIRTIFG